MGNRQKRERELFMKRIHPETEKKNVSITSGLDP